MTEPSARDNRFRLPSSSVAMKALTSSASAGGRNDDRSGQDISCIPLGVNHIGPPHLLGASISTT
jgi:hypothetical protein